VILLFVKIQSAVRKCQSFSSFRTNGQ